MYVHITLNWEADYLYLIDTHCKQRTHTLRNNSALLILETGGVSSGYTLECSMLYEIN